MSLDPRLISGTPWKNRTAYADLSGILALTHRAIAQQISLDLQVAVRYMPLGSADITSDSFLFALQSQMADECRALAITPPADIQSFDLTDESEFASWSFLVASETSRIKSSAGVP